MEIDKEKLLKDIENIIAKGVAECEEVDVTAKKVFDEVWFILVRLIDNKDSFDKIKHNNLPEPPKCTLTSDERN